MNNQSGEFSIFGKGMSKDTYPQLARLTEMTDNTADIYATVVDRMVTTGELGRLLSELIAMARQNGPLSERRTTNSNGLSIVADRYKYLSLVSLGEFKTFDLGGIKANVDNQFLANFRNPTIISNCGDENVHLKRYRFNPPHGIEVFQAGCPLQIVGEERIAPGQSRLFENAHEIIEFATAGFDRMLVAVTTLRFRESDLIWMFDQASMSSVRAVSASHSATRAELLLEMLDTAAYAPAAKVFQAQLDSPKHFVRWRSIRSLLKLSPKDGIDALRRSTEDPHPHVRKAALQTLKNLRDRGVLEDENV